MFQKKTLNQSISSKNLKINNNPNNFQLTISKYKNYYTNSNTIVLLTHSEKIFT